MPTDLQQDDYPSEEELNTIPIPPLTNLDVAHRSGEHSPNYREPKCQLCYQVHQIYDDVESGWCNCESCTRAHNEGW